MVFCAQNAPRVKRQPLNKCLPRNCKLLVRRSPHLSNYAIKQKKRPHYILTLSHEMLFGLFSLLENEGERRLVWAKREGELSLFLYPHTFTFFFFENEGGRRLVGAKREGELSFYPRLAQS